MSDKPAESTDNSGAIPGNASNNTPDSPLNSAAPGNATPTAKASTKSGGGALAALALLVALGVAGVVGYQWYQERGTDDVLRQDLAKRLADMETRNKDVGERAAQAVAALRDTEVKLGVLEARLAESQGQQAALETLQQDLSRNRDEWAMAGIEQSVLLAGQQLQVAGNVRAALMALENADARLQRIDLPRYATLRRLLSRDTERLKALPQVDVYGAGARIDDAIATIDKLPLAMDARPRPDAVVPAVAAGMPQWERMLREAWAELRQLVRIQSSGVPDVTLLAPEQVFFLRENLKLRLLGARIALLSRDARSYQGELRAARAALERHFDMRDNTVTTTAEILSKLQAGQIQTEMPDLSETLEALRKLRLPSVKGPA